MRPTNWEGASAVTRQVARRRIVEPGGIEPPAHQLSGGSNAAFGTHDFAKLAEALMVQGEALNRLTKLAEMSVRHGNNDHD